MVGADQHTERVDHDLRVRRSLGCQLAHAQLADDVIGGFAAPGLRQENQPFLKLEPRHLREDSLPQVDRGEQRGMGEKHLGPTQKKVPLVVQRVMEPRQDPTLRLRREIDERVAADQEVEPGDGRILGHVVAAEDHRAAKSGTKHQTLALAFEVPRFQVVVDRSEVLRNIAATSFGERILVDVGGVDLDPVDEGLLAERLAEQHRSGVRLFPG